MGYKKPANFRIKIKSPDFKITPEFLKANRFSMTVQIPGKDLIGYRQARFSLEAIPLADGSVEFRVHIGSKFMVLNERVVFDLIDWSDVDGRSVPKSVRASDSKKRVLAQRILEPEEKRIEHGVEQK